MTTTNTQSDQDIRDIVREKYAKIAVSTSRSSTDRGCCSTDCCTGDEETASSGTAGGYSMIGDAYDAVEGYVADADMGLGCGLPVEHAGLKPSHVVVDLGSGAGLDAFIARREIGESGRVIGVDMTPQMITKARANATAQGYDNVEFRLGEIENLPIDADSADVAISNCVLNLVPDKRRAFAEIYRILKPGGHFCISDVVSSTALPDWTAQIAELYVGCVSGAVPKSDYLAMISDSGFADISIKAEREINIPQAVLAQYATTEQIADAQTRELKIFSITVTGIKPR